MIALAHQERTKIIDIFFCHFLQPFSKEYECTFLCYRNFSLLNLHEKRLQTHLLGFLLTQARRRREAQEWREAEERRRAEERREAKERRRAEERQLAEVCPVLIPTTCNSSEIRARPRNSFRPPVVVQVL